MFLQHHHSKRKMDISKLLSSAFVLLAVIATPSSCQGPVYIDPNNAVIVEGPRVGPQPDLTTQTVYGFLDFTTTIGNTVMVFSPQSAPDPNEKPKQEDKTVIETKPSSEVKKTISEQKDIKPSKTVNKPASNNKEEKPSQEVTAKKEPQSIVNVIQGSASIVKEAPKVISSKVEVVAASSVVQQKPVLSKVDVIVGSSKVVEVAPKKVIYSKVEVKEGTKVQEPPKILSKVEVRSGATSVVKTAPKILSSHVEVLEASPSSSQITPILSSVVEVHSSSESEHEEEDEPVLIPNNNLGEPEYDFLSRQPSEIVEETYKVINLRPSKSHKPKHPAKARANPSPPPLVDDDEHPLGLVTKLGGTVVKDGVTTVHETSVIGTVISGKYAQVLHSSSHVYQGSGHKPKINASPTLKILKTAAPAQGKNHRFTLEPTPASVLSEESSLPLENLFGSSPSLIRPSRRPAISGGNFKNRYKQPEPSIEEEDEVQYKPAPNRNHANKKNKQQPRTFSNRFGKSSAHAPQLATVSVFSEPATSTYSNRRHKSSRAFKSTATTTPSDGYTRRGFKPKIQPSAVDQVSGASTTSLYKFKLNRTPGRWSYKTTPKPRVTIKKIIGFDEPTTPLTSTSIDDAHSNEVNPQSRSDNIDLELSGSHNGPGSLLDDEPNDNSIEKPPPIETIKVEISTPADFKDIYYEIATIKSPYTFQVGTVKNTRYITVTSTIEKSFEQTEISPVKSTEPLTENILATTSHFDKENNLLDTSIATLPPIVLNGDVETPPLETLTETFSTTQVMLKTHILPVIYNGVNTSSLTLIQTYHVTRLVTATKTLPPMEIYQFVPSKTLNEFNSRLDEAGSELHLELDFGDDNENDDEGTRRAFPADLDLANIGSEFDLSEVDKSRYPDHLRHKKAHSSNPKAQQVTEAPTPSTPALTPEQAQQLALLRLLNPAAAAQIPNVITTSKPVIKVETLYESHVIPFFNGHSTAHSTISRPVATVTKTEYEVGTSTLLPIPQLNPLFPQQNPLQNPFQITSTPIVTQTEVTATESKVLKLTFGAKTAYTTLYSTKVVPTVLTTYLTASVPVQPSAAYPGYFPAPYAPFPFVG